MHNDSRNVVIWVPRLVRPQTRQVLSKVIKDVAVSDDSDGDIVISRSGSMFFFSLGLIYREMSLNILQRSRAGIRLPRQAVDYINQ